MNNIEIKGNTTQKEDVDPEKPKEIKNEVILSVIDNDGKQKQIPIDIAFNGLKEGEYFFKENDKWYLHKLEDRTERIKMMNNIEILEKLKDEQYTKETVNTLYEFYDEEFKPYVLSTEERDALENLIQENKELNEKRKDGTLSDGYHTYNDLYYQRCVLFATICNLNKDISWKSKKHSDGKKCFDSDNWFIVGIDTPEGSYTYHYEMKYWDMFNVKELEIGKIWDGHTEKDVTRLLTLVEGE